jgi:hypothetical protein
MAENTSQSLDGKQSEFAAHFYEEINNAMGGTNPNEKLCLLLPGIALTKSDFEYDYKNCASKGPVIEANESRLANKLYDPMDMVGGDNGKTLERQYRSALDMLTPKVNPIIAEAKNELRRLLMKPFPYKFAPKNIMRAEIWNDNETILISAPADEVTEVSEDETKTYTFQEVFFRLYNEYVEQLGEWAKQRQRRKDFFVKRAESITDEKQKNKKAENDYLQWYEDNGETWLTAVNQKMSVLLSIFSATDMKIIEGILDCGSGAELQEARQTLNNTRKINPDGGYIYPVKFNPTNWFEYLDTSFTPVDLLNSPTAILDELKLLYNRRDYIYTRITDIAAEVNANDSTIDNLKKAVDEARADYIKKDDALQNAMEDTFGDFAKFITKAICKACGAGGTGANDTTIKEKITDAVSVAAGQKQEEAQSKATDILESLQGVLSNLGLGSNEATTIKSCFNNANGVYSLITNNLVPAIKQISDSDIKTVINKITTKISNTATSEEDKKTLEEVKAVVSGLSNAVASLTKTKTETEAKTALTSTSVKTDNTKNATGLAKDLGSAISSLGIPISAEETAIEGINIIFEGSKNVNQAQSDYLSSITKYTTALDEHTTAENFQNYKLQLNNLNIDQKNVESKISVLEAKLSQINDFSQCFSDSTTPPTVPEGFTQFNIVHTVTDTTSSSNESTSTVVTSTTKGFWCFKTKKRTVSTRSSIEKLCSSTGTEIEIGMNVAKVGIEREWFNPGIFALTGEMYNVAEKTEDELKAELDEPQNSGKTIDKLDKVLRISHGIGNGNAEDMYTLSHDVFPCYPTSMIIARDVTIKVTTTSSSDQSRMSSATRDVSNSKAFFVFNAGNGSHAHSSSGKAKSKSNSRAVTIRFNTPQIIGYFLQIVPKDKSTEYPSDNIQKDENDIVAFVQAYEKVIKERLDAENGDTEVETQET